MYITAQRAFGVSPDRHFRLLHAAVEEKPKIIVLSVIVLEAEGLEAKDANGEFPLFFRNLSLKIIQMPTVLLPLHPSLSHSLRHKDFLLLLLWN